MVESRAIRNLPLIICLMASPFLLLVGFVSAGAGHGSYVWARILFPFAAIALALGMPPLILILSVVQYPVYGLLLTGATRREKFLIAAFAIVVVHALCVVPTFTVLSGPFS